MVCQILKLSDSQVFREFSDAYKIFREVFDSGLFGLELRSLSNEQAAGIFKIILNQSEICYKRQSEEELSDLFLTGTINQLKKSARSVISGGYEDIGYKVLSTISSFEDYDKTTYTIGKREFRFDHPYVMGILNVTPDSFSDGGLFYSTDNAIDHALGMIDSGADIIDVGGESTRPGSLPVNTQEELTRVIPVIEGIINKRPDTVISIDTSKSRVAEEALKAGALIVNDISGLTFDPLMPEVIKKYNASVIIMHMKGTPRDMQNKANYKNVVKEVFDFLRESTYHAEKEGIGNIIIDPGIGFAKTAEHNIELLKRLEDFKCLGYPILTGVSRKSFLGKLTDLEVTERDTPTVIAETAAILNGARIIRTHNVKYGRYVTTITGKFL